MIDIIVVAGKSFLFGSQDDSDVLLFCCSDTLPQIENISAIIDGMLYRYS